MSLDATIAEGVRQALVTELPGAIAEVIEVLKPTPGLDDKPSLAAKLKISPRQVDVLRGHGLPTVMVGDLVRFDFAEVVVWLRAQRKAAANG
jgi:hypothetical protein